MSALDSALKAIRDDKAKQEAIARKVREAVLSAVLNEANGQATPTDATAMRQAIELEVYSPAELRELVDLARALRAGAAAQQALPGANLELQQAEEHLGVVKAQHVERINAAGHHFRESREHCNQLVQNALQISIIKKSHPELHAEWLQRQEASPSDLDPERIQHEPDADEPDLDTE